MSDSFIIGNGMTVREAIDKDLSQITQLAGQLWPGHEAAALREEMEQWITGEDSAVFLIEIQGEALGFAQCGLRYDYVEGCEIRPAAYLEGIFVTESQRGKGCGRALFGACEKWGRERDAAEFASDCSLSNQISEAFHIRMGFQEVNRIICFAKKL